MKANKEIIKEVVNNWLKQIRKQGTFEEFTDELYIIKIEGDSVPYNELVKLDKELQEHSVYVNTIDSVYNNIEVWLYKF